MLLNTIKKKYRVEIIAPLYYGETIPTKVNIIKKKVIASIYTPVPIRIENNNEHLGLLNTSPLTFFQAISSSTKVSSL
jgi:hypothetical protein